VLHKKDKKNFLFLHGQPTTSVDFIPNNSFILNGINKLTEAKCEKGRRNAS
jgi:hypothetical protein